MRTQFVVVPPGDEAKPISCPICKEPLKSEFLEDDEEWVWRNAVKKDDKVSTSLFTECARCSRNGFRRFITQHVSLKQQRRRVTWLSVSGTTSRAGAARVRPSCALHRLPKVKTGISRSHYRPRLRSYPVLSAKPRTAPRPLRIPNSSTMCRRPRSAKSHRHRRRHDTDGKDVHVVYIRMRIRLLGLHFLT